MSVFETFNLIASVFSIVTGAVALALAVVFYLNAKKAEKSSDNAMVEIKSSTAQLSKLSMRLLDRLTIALVAPRPTEEKLVDALGKLTTESLLKDTKEDGEKASPKELEQMRFDNLIAAMYYAALANLTTQSVLPSEPEDTEAFNIYKIGLDQSAEDYKLLVSWILNTKDYERKLNTSSVKHLYERAKPSVLSIKSMAEFYGNNQ